MAADGGAPSAEGLLGVAACRGRPGLVLSGIRHATSARACGLCRRSSSSTHLSSWRLDLREGVA